MEAQRPSWKSLSAVSFCCAPAAGRSNVIVIAARCLLIRSWNIEPADGAQCPCAVDSFCGAPAADCPGAAGDADWFSSPGASLQATRIARRGCAAGFSVLRSLPVAVAQRRCTSPANFCSSSCRQKAPPAACAPSTDCSALASAGCPSAAGGAPCLLAYASQSAASQQAARIARRVCALPPMSAVAPWLP